MKIAISSLCCLFVLYFCSTGFAQLPTPGPEHEVLKKDLGKWECKLTDMTGATSEGSEVGKSLGGFWLLTDFEGKLFGQEFKGHGIYGYDSAKKKYVGTWCDSLGSAKMDMTGDWDAESETLTLTGESLGMDMKPAIYTMANCYKDSKRVMTMHVQPKAGGDKVKMFEIVYSRPEAKK